jgi:prevent-host-death family protein
MEKVTATEVKNRLGTYLDHAAIEPIVVEKSGRPFVVMLSFDEYERLSALEDAHWGRKAKEAEKSGWASDKEVATLVKRFNREKAGT